MDDIAALTRLERSAVAIDAGPFYDDVLKDNSVIIRDNNGNLLQFFDGKPRR